MKRTSYDPWQCTMCGYQTDSVAHPTLDAVPQEGDLALCLNCGAVHTLSSGKWRLTNPAELADLTPEVRKQMELIHLARKIAITEDLVINQKFSSKRG